METPLILFCFNRPQKLQSVLAAVKRQTIKPGKIIAFVDGARSQIEGRAVDACARELSQLSGWTNTEIVRRDHNYGCAANIMYGINEITLRYGDFVVLEDDVLPATRWYESMLTLLSRYKHDPAVGTVGSFPSVLNGALASYPYDVILSPRFNAWGWGSWADRWRILFDEWKEWSVGNGLPYDPMCLPGYGGHDIGAMISTYAIGQLWDGIVAGGHLYRGWLQAVTSYYLCNNIGADIHLPLHKLNFMMSNNPINDRLPVLFPHMSVLIDDVSSAVCAYVHAMG